MTSVNATASETEKKPKMGFSNEFIDKKMASNKSFHKAYNN